MTRFIAIDPSSTFTGWAVFQDQGLVAWGKVDTRKTAYSERFPFIVGEVSRRASQYGAREVAIEDVKFAWHSKNRNRNIAGLQVVFRSIQEWAKGMDYPLAAYNPATWKNAVVGAVAAPKEITKNNIRYRFPAVPDDLSDHEYDAIAIGVYHSGLRFLEGMAEGGQPEIKAKLRYVFQMVDCSGCVWATDPVGEGCNCPNALRYDKGQCCNRREEKAARKTG